MSRICFQSYNVGGEVTSDLPVVGWWWVREPGTSLSFWSLFEVFHNNYNEKGDFESDFNEWTFCSPPDGKWSAEGGLRALNEFAEDQLSGLGCFVEKLFQGSGAIGWCWNCNLRYTWRQGLVSGEWSLEKSPRASKKAGAQASWMRRGQGQSQALPRPNGQIQTCLCSLW